MEIKKIKGVIKEYDWGSIDFLPSLFKYESNGKPQAEAWFGTHPSGEAVLEDGTLLSDGKNSYKATRYNILELMTSLKEEVDTMTNNVKRNLKSDVNTEYLQNIVEKLKDVQDSINIVNDNT